MHRFFLESHQVASRLTSCEGRRSVFDGRLLDAGGFLVRSSILQPMETLGAIAEKGNAIIVAEGGMGKTFVLNEFSESHQDIVALLHLAYYAGSVPELKRDVENAADKKYLFLDGLDEVPELCLPLVKILQDAKPAAHVLLASRSIPALKSFHENLKWPLFSLLPYTRDDVAELCKKEEKDFDAFMREIEGLGLGGVCARPLGCKLLLAAFGEKGLTVRSSEELWKYFLKRLCAENDLSATRSCVRHSMDVSPDECWNIALRVALVWKLRGKSSLARISAFADTEGKEDDFSQILPSGDCAKFNECLTRPIFMPLGHDRFCFAHSSYFDFMAAMEMIEHVKQSEWKKIVLSESGIPYPQWEGVVPWLAARDDFLLASIKKFRPDLLLGADAVVSKIGADEICRNILENSENIPYTNRENPAIQARYYALNTNGCAHVVIDALEHSQSDAAIDTAIDIAQRARHPSMVDALVEFFCNETKVNAWRESAGFALLDLANDQQRQKCRSLLAKPLSRRMLGILLHLLWPKHMTTEELLPRLVLDEDDSLDAYEYWLEFQFPKTLDGLSDADRQKLFRWAMANLEEDKHGHHRRFAVKLCVFLHCWQKAVSREDFDLMAQGLDAFSKIHRSPFSAHSTYEHIKNEYGWEQYVADVERRRSVARRLVENEEIPLQPFAVCCMQLLFPNDVGFIMDEIRSSTSARHRERWAVFLRHIVGGLVLPKDADAWDWLHQEFPRVFQSDAKTVMEEGAQVDREMRKFNEKRLEKTVREKNRRAIIHERNTQWVLAKFQNATVSPYFCNIMDAIRSQTPQEKPDYGFDFRKSALWQALSKQEIDMLVDAAHEFILAYDGPWPKENEYYPSHILAFYLLTSEAKRRLIGLPAAAWQKFAPELFHVYHHDIFDLARQTMELFAEHQTDAFLDELAKNLKRQLIASGFVGLYEFKTFIEVGNNVTRLLKALDSDEIEDQKRSNLYDEFWRLSDKQTKEYINESRFATVPLQENGLKTSVYLIASNPQRRFPELLALLKKDMQWGRDWCLQTLGQTGFQYSPFPKMLNQLSVKELKEFYAWMQAAFPMEEKPHHVGCYSPDAVDNVYEAMSAIFDELVSRVDKDVPTALGELATQFPQLTYLKDWVQHSKRMLLERDCPTYGIPSVKKLLESQEKGSVVNTATDLLEIVFDMLKEKYQTYLTGKETPRARDLWNDPNGGKEGLSHKDEAALSNHMKSFLELVLPKTVINREVKLNCGSSDMTGAQTDIWITAFSRCDNTRLRLCIEVKGSWNPSCPTAFQDQLCKKYMGDGGADAGIFLVGWFWAEQKTSHKNQWHNDRSEAERVLQQQERELSQQGYKVRHLILDCRYCR